MNKTRRKTFRKLFALTFVFGFVLGMISMIGAVSQVYTTVKAKTAINHALHGCANCPPLAYPPYSSPLAATKGNGLEAPVKTTDSNRSASQWCKPHPGQKFDREK